LSNVTKKHAKYTRMNLSFTFLSLRPCKSQITTTLPPIVVFSALQACTVCVTGRQKTLKIYVQRIFGKLWLNEISLSTLSTVDDKCKANGYETLTFTTIEEVDDWLEVFGSFASSK
jgi:hypothetical protein